jgi:L-threonylcarbamoyladenylate synthase
VATDLVEIDQEKPSSDSLDRAALFVRRGKVIGIPTDALYTLVADPFNLKAVQQVFIAKGREINRSLPILVADAMMAEELVKAVPESFHILARRFWPGPLAMILPASARIPLRATGNTGRLAVRHSSSAVVQGLIDRLGHPLIATSANISGSPTCRSGIDVFGMMDGRVDLVLDGGVCSGPGATTVDLTEPVWKMIREGAVSEKEIAACLDSE